MNKLPVPMLLEIGRAILPDWPMWALEVLLVMTACLILSFYLLSFYSGDAENSSLLVDSKKHVGKQQEFDKFKKQYLSVYLVIMLADWM